MIGDRKLGRYDRDGLDLDGLGFCWGFLWVGISVRDRMGGLVGLNLRQNLMVLG